MRPAIIMLILFTIFSGGLPACTGGQTSTPVETTPELSTLPATTNTSLPITTTQGTTSTTGPATIETSTAAATSEPPAPSSTVAETMPSGNLKVVGYITNWHLNRLSTLKLEGLTHLIFQGVVVTNGSDPTLLVANEAGWWQITDVVTAGHANNAKVLISLIGFWKESYINQIWQSPDLRGKLIENLKDLVVNYELDGVDIDNENSPNNPALYSTFIRELYAVLNPLGKIITMAVNPYGVSIEPEASGYLDFINVMTYDMDIGKGYPYHSTFEDSVKAIQLWAAGGVPKDKILIGIPFYGRDGDDTFYEYWWIVDKYKPGPDQNEISEPQATGGIIWWNGPDLAQEKTYYVRDNGFGGVMMYEIGTDSLDGFSLLESIYVAIEQPEKSSQTGITGSTSP